MSSVIRPSDIPLSVKKQDPQGLGKELVYGTCELAAATTLAAVALIEGSAAVCSRFTSTENPAQGYCATAETLSQATWIPTSYGLLPYAGATLALGADGARRIYNVTKVGFQGVKEDGKKAWKIFKEKATSMNKKYPAMAVGFTAGFFTSGLTWATAALGFGAYAAADAYNDYVGEPASKKKKEPSGYSAPIIDESGESEEEEAVEDVDGLGDPELFPDASAYQGAYESYSAPRSSFQLRNRRVQFHSAASAAPAASFFDAEAPATGKIRVKIGQTTYTFSNIRAAFYAHRYPSQAARFARTDSTAAEALASQLQRQGGSENPRWREINRSTMYFVIGQRLYKDPAARAQLRGMSDLQIDQIDRQFNSIGLILKQIRDWDKQRSTPVGESYPRQVAALAHTQDEL